MEVTHFGVCMCVCLCVACVLVYVCMFVYVTYIFSFHFHSGLSLSLSLIYQSGVYVCASVYGHVLVRSSIYRDCQRKL